MYWGGCRFEPAAFPIAESSRKGASRLPGVWGPQPPGLVLSDALLELSCRAWLLPCLPKSTLDLLRRKGPGREGKLSGLLGLIFLLVAVRG